jgi:hypothetical protein
LITSISSLALLTADAVFDSNLNAALAADIAAKISAPTAIPQLNIPAFSPFSFS